ncbi:MAG: hypothetical protein ABS76_04200 [Pelagibacterium sp. SCN 64-44]|mgnify:CR=1 FL=1|nr:MAG: hypothetical protein ABS76_04200 [Pelagibacterium sp. SCN 64-44]
MMIKTIAITSAAVLLMSAPAMAAACSGSFALTGELFTEAEKNDYNQDLLRGRGIDAVRTEMWGGCIRAWVRLPSGQEEMQFFEPLTLRRVE